MSELTDYYRKKVSDLEANPVGAYESKYQTAMDNVLNKITNREKFSYDFNADPLYQNYKDQYTKLGNEASMNAVANASAMTGGYGNSYAVTAGAQANQQYLTQLNEMIPKLAEQARSQYNQETSDLYNQYSLYGDAEDRGYNQYRDKVSDAQNALNYYQSAYQNANSNDQWQTSFDYQKERDTIADQQWQAEYNRAIEEYNQNLAYQKERDAVSDAQWNKTFDYNANQDALNYQLSLAKLNSKDTKSTSIPENETPTTEAPIDTKSSLSVSQSTIDGLQNAYNNASRNTTTSNAKANLAGMVDQLGLPDDEALELMNRIINSYK